MFKNSVGRKETVVIS